MFMLSSSGWDPQQVQSFARRLTERCVECCASDYNTLYPTLLGPLLYFPGPSPPFIMYNGRNSTCKESQRQKKPQRTARHIASKGHRSMSGRSVVDLISGRSDPSW